MRILKEGMIVGGQRTRVIGWETLAMHYCSISIVQTE